MGKRPWPEGAPLSTVEKTYLLPRNSSGSTDDPIMEAHSLGSDCAQVQSRAQTDARRPTWASCRARSPTRTTPMCEFRCQQWPACALSLDRADALSRGWPAGDLQQCRGECTPLHRDRPKKLAFAGSDSGGRRAAIFYTIIRTCVLNGIEPEAYLRDVLARIGEHPINRLHELLPWNIAGHARRDLAA